MTLNSGSNGSIPDFEFIGNWEDRARALEQELAAVAAERDRYRTTLEQVNEKVAVALVGWQPASDTSTKEPF